MVDSEIQKGYLQLNRCRLNSCGSKSVNMHMASTVVAAPGRPVSAGRPINAFVALGRPMHARSCFKGGALPAAQSRQQRNARGAVRVLATQTIGTKPLFAKANVFGGGSGEVFVAGGAW